MITPGDKPVPFRLEGDVRSRIVDTPVRWGHGGLSEVTFLRTYSRTKPDGTQESWGECVVRVIEGMFTIFKTHAAQNRLPWREPRAQKLAAEAAERLRTFKWTPPGRGLWMMGTDYIWERGGAALNNCAFVSTQGFDPRDDEETLAPFRFMMDTAMLGVGPGFDTRGAGKVGVRGAQGGPAVYRVPDTREGWVEAVALQLRAHLFGAAPIVLDVQDVRPEGAPLRGFGGVASGPLPLVQGVAGIGQLLEARRGRDLDSVTITDIMNVIGKIVVAGNVRRTAEIAFADPSDEAFRSMKTHGVADPTALGAAPPEELTALDPGAALAWASGSTKDRAEVERRYAEAPWAWKFNGWRWASNNSLFASVGMDYRPAAEQIAVSGEPGFAWLDLMRGYGRLRDPRTNADHRVMGANPCVEQSLESFEMCNLVENFPNHCEDYWDFQRTLKFSYMYGKAVTLMGTHWERSNEVMIRNRRIGCSMSGVVDAVARVGRTEFFQRWCEDGYSYIGYVDRKYSDWLGVRESVKKTSVKPSGTVTLVAGAHGAGAHFPKPTGYRTMRIAANSPLVAALRAANYRVEPAATDPIGTAVVYFPWIVPEGVVTSDRVSIWEQFRYAADLQHWWADNQVSYTAEFSEEEAERGEIARCLEAHDGQLKGISLLPRATGNYAQMPYTAAPREEVVAYAAQLLPLALAGPAHDTEDRWCEGGACQVPEMAAAAPR